MIRHIVLVKFQPASGESDVAAIFDGLSRLVGTLKGARGFTSGISESPEHLERGYKHGFVVDFDDWSDLKRYADHPTHKSLGAQMVERAEGGLDGILVVDLHIPD